MRERDGDGRGHVMDWAGPSVTSGDALRSDYLQRILIRKINLRDHTRVYFPASSGGVAPKADTIQTLTTLPHPCNYEPSFIHSVLNKWLLSLNTPLLNPSPGILTKNLLNYPSTLCVQSK